MKKQVAFAGGGFLVLQHVGAIEAMAELGIEIEGAAGTSAGALAAALSASTLKPGKELNDLILSFFPANKKLISSNVWKFPWRFGLLKLDKLEAEIQKYLPKTFGECPHPVAVFVANPDLQEIMEFSTGETPDEAMAPRVVDSCRIPGVFQARRWEGYDLTDGGIGYNYPLDFFNDEDNRPPENLLGVRFDGTIAGALPPRKKWWNVVQNNVRHYAAHVSLAMKRSTIEAIDDAQDAQEIVLSVPEELQKQGVDGLKFDMTVDQARALIAAGREQTLSQLKAPS